MTFKQDKQQYVGTVCGFNTYLQIEKNTNMNTIFSQNNKFVLLVITVVVLDFKFTHVLPKWTYNEYGFQISPFDPF